MSNRCSSRAIEFSRAPLRFPDPSDLVPDLSRATGGGSGATAAWAALFGEEDFIISDEDHAAVVNGLSRYYLVAGLGHGRLMGVLSSQTLYSSGLSTVHSVSARVGDPVRSNIPCT